MSPSINEMFSAPGSEAEDDFELDIDKLMSATDTALEESRRRREPEIHGQDESEPEPEPEVEADQPAVEPQPADDEETTGESTEAGEAPTPPPAALDPLGLLPPERRAALLAIDEVVQSDPAKRDRVLAALRDEAEAAVAPKLPEDIEEGSVAARLWHDNQATQAQLAQIAAGQKAIAETTARQAAASAAEAAGAEFARRYPQLENDDVVRIAEAAGGSGLAARLANGADDLKGAYVAALETTLWTNEGFRAKATVEAPAEPTVADKHVAESKPRKRKLTALSSAASPSSAPTEPRSALETRADGKLTPQSRLSVVGELASKLARERNEGMY